MQHIATLSFKKYIVFIDFLNSIQADDPNNKLNFLKPCAVNEHNIQSYNKTVLSSLCH